MPKADTTHTRDRGCGPSPAPGHVSRTCVLAGNYRKVKRKRANLSTRPAVGQLADDGVTTGHRRRGLVLGLRPLRRADPDPRRDGEGRADERGDEEDAVRGPAGRVRKWSPGDEEHVQDGRAGRD